MIDCKNCEFNNNGWCKKYKMQKPSAVVKCEEDNENMQELSNNKYITAGKIRAFSDIVRQIDASENAVTDEFKGVMKALYKSLEVEVKIHGMPSDSEYDEFILKDLRHRMIQW